MIERFLRLVYSAINNPEPPGTVDYRQIRLNIFSALQIPQESDQWKAFAILVNIRNTIHNNGIFINKKESPG